MKKITIIMMMFLILTVICSGCSKTNIEKETETSGEISTSQTEDQNIKELTLSRCNIETLDPAAFEKLFKEALVVNLTEVRDGKQVVRMETEGAKERAEVYVGGGYYSDSSSLDVEDFYSTIKNEFYFFNEAGDKNWTDYFNTETECGFLTKNELTEIIDGIICGFGITDYELDICTVSEEKFNEYSKWYYVTLNDEAKEMSEAYFGKYEEFYYIQVYPKLDGITVSDAALGDIEKGLFICGPHITLSYTEKGLTQLRMTAYLDLKSAESTNEKKSLISEQDARKKLEAKFENMLVNNVSEYTMSELVLLPYPYYKGGEIQYYILTPYWKFSDGKQLEIYFNAITGEEIVGGW